MSVFAPRASQISILGSCIPGLQFHGQKRGRYYRFVSLYPPGATQRGPAPSPVSRYKAAEEKQVVQGSRCAMRAVLAVVFLCTAFSLGRARAEPSEEIIQHGKALTIAADCAGCH